MDKNNIGQSRCMKGEGHLQERGVSPWVTQPGTWIYLSHRNRCHLQSVKPYIFSIHTQLICDNTNISNNSAGQQADLKSLYSNVYKREAANNKDFTDTGVMLCLFTIVYREKSCCALEAGNLAETQISENWILCL